MDGRRKFAAAGDSFESDIAPQAIEVAAMLGEELLEVRYLCNRGADGRQRRRRITTAYTVGPDPSATYKLAPQEVPSPVFPLVRLTGHGYEAHWTARMSGH